MTIEHQGNERAKPERPPLLGVPALSGMMADTFDSLVNAVVHLDGMISQITAIRALAIDQARLWSGTHEQVTTSRDPLAWDSRTIARKVLVSELACALRLPERTTENLVATSEALLHDLPDTFQALHSGDISYRHAQSVVDHVSSLGTGVMDADRSDFEAQLLPLAGRMSVAKFDRAARRLREKAHPESICARHQRALDDRHVILSPDHDGMAWLSMLLSAPVALAAYDRLCAEGKALQSANEPRTLAQLRADIAGRLLTDGVTADGVGVGARATVFVTIPMMTLLGKSTEPATLEGYGPIDPATARELAAGAPSLRRILTHPVTGAVLDVGRDTFAISTRLRTWLRFRDGTCRFPGCNTSAARSDVDHTVDRAFGGPTAPDNLAHLCPQHHKLKHNTAWRAHHHGNGHLQWTSPSGRVYSTEPAYSVASPQIIHARS